MALNGEVNELLVGIIPYNIFGRKVSNLNYLYHNFNVYCAYNYRY